ncbi:hypothetical protein F2P81_015582 [Scophthalmus maximus]|uniref:Uncharacterized protein n=1 Tax=Scophthalmus maximus TaxID=52904 RepID=A0A6A4ST64_SCOMX|nr:hypothetical protein F2P81_015582 [Scophthalmus maximus]
MADAALVPECRHRYQSECCGCFCHFCDICARWLSRSARHSKYQNEKKGEKTKVTLQDSWVRLLPDSKPVLPDLPLRSLRYSFLRRGRRDERHPHAVVEVQDKIKNFPTRSVDQRSESPRHTSYQHKISQSFGGKMRLRHRSAIVRR